MPSLEPHRVAAPGVFDPTSPEFRKDRHAVYRSYRDHEPIHWRPAKNGGGRWMLFRHADVRRALNDPAFGREFRPKASHATAQATPRPFPALTGLLSDWLIFRDAPEHDRMRSTVSRAFSPVEVARLRRRAETLTESLLDELESRSEFDLVEDFACALSLRVVAELIGLDELDVRRLRGWSVDMVPAIDAEPSPSALARADVAAAAMTAELRNVVASRRIAPRADLISQVLATADGEPRLTENELVANCVLLVGAGHETTTSSISYAATSLLADREAFARAAADSAGLRRALEECLRYESPVQITARVVQRDVELGGHRLEPGQHVDLVIGSANRDENVFVDPDRLDLTRAPGENLAFGIGRHFCIGAPLARMEAEVAVAALLRRGARWKVVEHERSWRPMIAFRALERSIVRR